MLVFPDESRTHWLLMKHLSWEVFCCSLLRGIWLHLSASLFHIPEPWFPVQSQTNQARPIWTIWVSPAWRASAESRPENSEDTFSAFEIILRWELLSFCWSNLPTGQSILCVVHNYTSCVYISPVYLGVQMCVTLRQHPFCLLCSALYISFQEIFWLWR